MFDTALLTLSNFELDYFESKTTKEFLNFESEKKNYVENGMAQRISTITNCKVTNVISRGVLFRIKNGVFSMTNCEFRNIHECYMYNNCTSISSGKPYVEDAELLIGYGDDLGGGYFYTSIIDRMFGNNGILIYTAKISVTTSTISNSYFKNGFLHMDEKHLEGGGYSITSSTFENNTSEYGTIFNFPYINPKTEKNSIINFSSCKFINNTASKFGGVILSGVNGDRIAFPDCIFINNHAKFGNVVYAHSKDALPSFENLDSTDISTTPVDYKMFGNIVEDILILSGDRIPEGIMFKLYDDFGNQIYFSKETSNIQYEDLVLFNVEVNDTYNAKVIGQTKDYCWDEACILPPVNVIGNPGIYTLSLKFKSFGMYPYFAKDSIDIEIEIRKCNERKYLYQAIDDAYLKSCYEPKCEYNCNGGICVNNDLCDCTKVNLKGQFCNEYIKLEKYPILDTFFIVVASVIIVIIIGLIVMTTYFRKHTAIKGSGYEFLIIILIGLIINTVNAIFLTFEKTTYLCYQTYLLSNTGFSFVFGSIFVKTFRIYKIFCNRKKLKMGLKKKKMYLIIISMTLFHWMMALLWFHFRGIKVEDDYTVDEKVYERCKYHQSKNISSLFNFVILIVEFFISYSIRKVDKKYKEALLIPAYVYILYMLLMYFMENQKEINVVMRDYFDIAGTITNTLVSIYDLFIIKFIEIYTVKHIHNSLNSIKRVSRRV